DSGLRSQPASPRHRLHRHLSSSWIRRAHAHRRSSEHAEPPGRKRKGPLHRLLKFFRLALDEIPGHFRALWLAPLRWTPGLLFAHRKRVRMGAYAAWSGPGSWRTGLEPAGLGPFDRKDSARPTLTLRQPPP